MAKKRKTEKPKREFTKHQLSRWQQQQKRQRIILGIGIFIIVAVLGIMGAGWFITQYQPLQKTVIKVNDTEFDMNYYIKMLKVYGGGQPSYYMYGGADEVVELIEQNELMRQGAMELGISVSNEEVDEELKSYDPPLTKDYRDMVRIELLISKLVEEYFDQQVPLFAEQRHIVAMLLESESQAAEVRARLESGEEFGELAGELSLGAFSEAGNGDLGWHPEDILAELLATSIPGRYAFDADIGVLSQPMYDETVIKGVGYWLVEVLEIEEDSEEAHVQAILLGSDEEAQVVKARLEAGEDFATLAEELSQLEVAKEDGGDLGWLTSGALSPVVDEFVFNGEAGILSEPIRDDMTVTTGGYWLVKVLDKDDNKEISNEDRNLLKGVALNEWVASLWDNPENEVDSYLDDRQKAWAIVKAMES